MLGVFVVGCDCWACRLLVPCNVFVGLGCLFQALSVFGASSFFLRPWIIVWGLGVPDAWPYICLLGAGVGVRSIYFALGLFVWEDSVLWDLLILLSGHLFFVGLI